MQAALNRRLILQYLCCNIITKQTVFFAITTSVFRKIKITKYYLN